MTFVKNPDENSAGSAADGTVKGVGEADLEVIGGGAVKKPSSGQEDPGPNAGEIAGRVVGHLASGRVGGAAGEVLGAVASGPAAGVLRAAGGGIASSIAGGKGTGIVADQELPVFEEKAITTSAVKAAAGFVGGGLVGKAAGALGVSGRSNLEVEIASGDSLDVRQFSVRERISGLFQVDLIAVSENPSIDFDSIVGQSARFALNAGTHTRFWKGVCNLFEQVRIEASGLSTYHLSIVPTLWFLTQRKNFRMFQQSSEPDIALKMLEEWNIQPEVQIDKAAYKKRKYRVQYAESDFTFLSRMLEDAGISYYFEQIEDETKLVLSDAPQGNPRRPNPLTFLDDVSMVRSVDIEFVTGVRMSQRVRPGKYTMRDHDYRRPPSYKLMASAAGGKGIEEKLERFHYLPGAFLFGTDQGDATPSADDKGKARVDEKEAAILAQKRLDAKRGAARNCSFETNAHDLAPGVVMSIVGHQHAALGESQTLLVTESSLSGSDNGEWSHSCEARGTEIPFRPAVVTPKPKVNGVESATVVGPPGEEIHTDEFGRVRVHFHWDRESKMDDGSSCWIHVSQPWGGAGYGASNLPRIGQEVLVDFLGGDPDRPVIVGRLYTNLQKTPYKLPENKTQSGWKSNSTGGGGGYNELMFEDAAGKELLRMQAEKDMNKLVKNDEQSVVGRDRTREVKRNESVTVGKNRTKQVVKNERVTIGENQSITVGINRSAYIGSIDSTTVGGTHSVMIAPPGEGGPSSSSSITMTDKKIILNTGAGATITMHRNKITLDAKTVTVVARDNIELRGKKRGLKLAAPAGAAKVITGKSFNVSTTKIALNGSDVKITAGKLALSGKSSADLTSSGATTVSGTPVQLNGPGLFAGRVTELAPATITTGAALVVIGGASFPFPVEKLSDGSLKIGDHLIVKPGTGRYDNFQNKVMRDLGVMSSTPSGMERLNNIQNNPGGHDVTIREYSAAEEAQYGKNNSLCYPGAGQGDPNALGYDANGNPVPGAGMDSDIAYNPDIVSGPNGHPEPADATLFHEMGHAEHNAYGTNRQWETTGDGWENREEQQTIDHGANTPGGQNIPGVPSSPSENDYLGDRDYPYIRTDHGGGYSNPDGTPIKP
jgi:type VI secretion system secreted protein VgrG